MTDKRHRAWSDVHDLLPEGWAVGPVTYDPGRRRWTVAARGPLSGHRQRPPEFLEVDFEDELHALKELFLALREMARPGRMAELERRIRLAYYRGAEESHRTLGRGLTRYETEHIGEGRGCSGGLH